MHHHRLYLALIKTLLSKKHQHMDDEECPREHTVGKFGELYVGSGSTEEEEERAEIY